MTLTTIRNYTTSRDLTLKTRIPPETYAQRKQELLADRDAWEAKMAQVEGFFQRSGQIARHEREDA